jgi:hypothetical protein
MFLQTVAPILYELQLCVGKRANKDFVPRATAIFGKKREALTRSPEMPPLRG